ncbi:MucR family transcriptional regulator [Streptomyces sp. ISL-98]|uniref:MucR family transcriptional regulator n=1 Tax=Streptomyces sp. ISL-98 TaxID=2819192 RepID=UPI001BECB5DB|nr:MucR family transcriptional regulator [Streptomyces sp. ISL-98]MBT2511519.1 MucR family transcriptional regulator [Streptomyces sp. ISL-98]
MTTPAGQQPQSDGRLMCLDCGSWYKLLAPHLARAHGTTTVAYREAHRLPRKLSLRAADLNARAREQGRARYASRPDIRQAMEAGRAVNDFAAAVAASRVSARYDMVRAARRKGGAGKREAARRRIDARAQARGYATIEAYFAARAAASVASMARELAVARTTVDAWLLKTGARTSKP